MEDIAGRIVGRRKLMERADEIDLTGSLEEQDCCMTVLGCGSDLEAKPD